MENVSSIIKEDAINQGLIYWNPLQSYNQGGCRKSRTDLLESSTMSMLCATYKICFRVV